MLEKITGALRIKKLRIIQLIEADMNQVLRSAFTKNISKLAQETLGISIEHQYVQSQQTCLTPVMKKLLAVQLLIQKKTNGIVFDNDRKVCYDRIVSGIALAALQRIGYSKKFMRMASCGPNWNTMWKRDLGYQKSCTRVQLTSFYMVLAR
jgi:hypothetical protein